MPQPRIPPGGADPYSEIADEVEGDIAFDYAASKAWASQAVHHWMPVVETILDESERLLTLSPSASVVWSIQTLEVFIKKGVLESALRARLGFDPELGEAIFKALLGRNGPKAAEEWLNHLIGLSREYTMSSSLASLWSGLFGKRGALEWRNRIVHQGEVASVAEAQQALRDVREFVHHVRTYLEPSPGSALAPRPG